MICFQICLWSFKDFYYIYRNPCTTTKCFGAIKASRHFHRQNHAIAKIPLRHKSHHHKSFWGPPRPRGPRHCAQLIRLSCSRVAWYFHHGAAPCFRISRHRAISFSRDYQAITSYPVIKHRNSTSMNNQTR